jgi:DNA polymerase (family X)
MEEKENAQIAARLREAAALLDAQAASPHRVNAYRHAADVAANEARALREIFDAQGRAGLQALPAIGAGISSAIAEMLITGRWSLLERLRGGAEPEALLRAVPGIGPELARTIHDALHVETLEALEIAAHDGRLEALPAIGPRRAAAIRASLGVMLGRRPLRGGAPRPTVEQLLDVDREYRAKSAARELPRIAPRRFNPGRKAWLPVLHTQRGAWHFTALNSNTALAHRLGRMRDWVVIYYYDGDHREGQCTVVTETRGTLAGERVVRGREVEILQGEQAWRAERSAAGKSSSSAATRAARRPPAG